MCLIGWEGGKFSTESESKLAYTLDWFIANASITSLMEVLNYLAVKMKWFYFSHNCCWLLSWWVASSLKDISVQNLVCDWNGLLKAWINREPTYLLSKSCSGTSLKFHPRVGKEWVRSLSLKGHLTGMQCSTNWFKLPSGQEYFSIYLYFFLNELIIGPSYSSIFFSSGFHDFLISLPERFMHEGY